MPEIKTGPLQCAINFIFQASLSKYFVPASIKILQLPWNLSKHLDILEFTWRQMIPSEIAAWNILPITD